METPLNILLISHYFLPRHTAGTEIYTYRLGMALKNRGHSVQVLAGEDDPAALQPRLWDEDVMGLPITFMAPKRMSKWEHMRQSLRDGQRPELEPLFEHLLDRLKLQVIHIQQLSTLSATFIDIAKRRGIPVVVMLNDYWFLCQRVQLITSTGDRCQGFESSKCADCLLANYPWAVRIFGKSAARTASQKRFNTLMKSLQIADQIISPSRHLKQVYEKHGIASDRILHCDYGFPLPDSKTVPQPGTPLNVGYLGSLVSHKGLHVLIDAVNWLNGNAHLTIYGSPDSNPTYYRELQNRKLDYVEFAGMSDPQNPYPTIAKHDVMVVPSLWEENSPLVIHEAHAAGRPVIASSVGGIIELIKDGIDGILVPPGDVNALSEALNSFILNPQLLTKMSRQTKPPKSIDDHALEIDEIYQRLVSGQPAI